MAENIHLQNKRVSIGRLPGATLPEPPRVTCSLWHWHVSLPRLTQCDSVEIIISGPYYRALTPLPRPDCSGGPPREREGAGGEREMRRKCKKKQAGRWENGGISLTKRENRFSRGTRPAIGAFLLDFMAYSVPQEAFKEALWSVVIWKVHHLLNNDVKICYLPQR